MLHVGDFGQPIDVVMLDAERKAIDLSVEAVDVKELHFVKPGGNESSPITEDAVFTDGSGANGVLRFVIEDCFLDVAGTWKVRAFAEKTSTKAFRTIFAEFLVSK